LLLVLSAAFGPSIVDSVAAVLAGPEAYAANGSSPSLWENIVRQVIGLCLLCYVLFRQEPSLKSIGLDFKISDVPISIVLTIVGYLSYWALLNLLMISYYKSVGSPPVPWRGAGGVLGPTFSWAAAFMVIVNPVFEELIVKAYVITEVTALTGSILLASLASVLLQDTYHLYQGWLNAAALTGLSLVTALYYAKFRRVLPVILCHFYFDAVAFWIIVKGYY